jgi:hypothetical protein
MLWGVLGRFTAGIGRFQGFGILHRRGVFTFFVSEPFFSVFLCCEETNPKPGDLDYLRQTTTSTRLTGSVIGACVHRRMILQPGYGNS